MARPGGFEPPTLGSEDRAVDPSGGFLMNPQAKPLLLFAIIALVLLSSMLSRAFFSFDVSGGYRKVGNPITANTNEHIFAIAGIINVLSVEDIIRPAAS